VHLLWIKKYVVPFVHPVHNSGIYNIHTKKNFWYQGVDNSLPRDWTQRCQSSSVWVWRKIHRGHWRKLSLPQVRNRNLFVSVSPWFNTSTLLFQLTFPFPAFVFFVIVFLLIFNSWNITKWSCKFFTYITWCSANLISIIKVDIQYGPFMFECWGCLTRRINCWK
jgi:hypothetical protein